MLVLMYAGPIAAVFRVQAFAAPSATTALPSLAFPAVTPPLLRVPKLQRLAPLPAAPKKTAAPATHASQFAPTHRSVAPSAAQHKVAVITDEHSQQAPAPSTSTPVTDPYANVPVETDTIGVVTALPASASTPVTVTTTDASTAATPVEPTEITIDPTDPTPAAATQHQQLFHDTNDPAAGGGAGDTGAGDAAGSGGTTGATPGTDTSSSDGSGVSASGGGDTSSTPSDTGSTPSDTGSTSGGDTSGTTSATTPPATTSSSPAPVTITASGSGSHSISASVSGSDLVVTIDGTSSSQAVASVSSLTLVGGTGDDTFTVDPSLAGAGFSVTFDGGAGTDTLDGPGVDSNWSITGSGAGTVGGVAFTGFENLTGAAGNKDVFDFAAGSSLSGTVDGGAGGFDTVKVTGNDSVVSNPTDAHSGTLVVDGATITYTGMEPTDVTAPTVTINGADSSADLKKDKLSVTQSGGTVTITDHDPLLDTSLAEDSTMTISSVGSLIINGGKGVDSVEFKNDITSSNLNLTVNAEHITVDSGVTLSLGTGDLAFNATYRDNGVSALGITTTLLGVDPSITLDGAHLSAHNIDLEATAGTLKTKASGAQTLSSAGSLNVASTDGFDDSGTFQVGTQTCSYTAITATQFQNLSGCTGSVADGDAVHTDIEENGNGLGINYAGVQLIYTATIDVKGSSTLTATGNVTMASTVDVAATADAAGGPDKGAWTSGTSYAKGDVVTASDGKRYAAKSAIANDTTAPQSDATNWSLADSKDSSVAATVLVATAQADLSGTATITATSGDVTISASMTAAVTTKADSSASGTGAGIAVGVVVTNAYAYVDSTASEPVHAKSLTLTADTNDSSPTTGKSSPKGSEGNDTSANDPTNNPANGGSTAQHDAAGGKADGLSKTSDGNQNNSAALAVTVLVATTHAYIAPNDAATPHTFDVGTGALKVHAGVTGNASAEADAGNVKFSPDAPTVSATGGGGHLVGGTTYYYRVSALFNGDNSTTVNGASQSLAGGTLTVASTTGWDSSGVFKVGTAVCSYASKTATSFTGITGCTGTPSNGATVQQLDESMPGPEGTFAAAGSTSDRSSGLTWVAVPNAVGYRVYRGTSTGDEKLLDATTGTTYTDNSNTTPTGDMPTEDAKSGIGVAVAVNVVVLDTQAWLGGNLALTAGGGTTVETIAPGTGTSTFSAHSISGAGGTGTATVAGSVAVNVVTTTAGSSVLTAPAAVELNGNDLTITAKSNQTNSAIADAKQSTDGNTVGIGASFALNVINDTTSASLPDDVALTGTKNLTLTADATDATTTTANGGASAGTGSLALSAQVAITLSNVTTSASIGSGSTPYVVSGGVTAHATQTASTATTAKGSTSGGTAGIGLSLALLIANHLVDSQLSRSLQAAGAVSFTADGSSSNDTEATASSAGAKEKASNDPNTDNGDGSSKPDVNSKADSNLSLANNTSSSHANGKTSGSTSTPDAKSGENGGTKVTVAAAAAIAIVTAKALSTFADNLTLTNPTGATSFNTTEDADSTAKANGSATKAQTANIGAAVAINLVTIWNKATIGDSNLNVGGLTLSATMRTTGGADGKNKLDTEATAGAGGGKVGIAGSLALTIADVQTNAELLSNSGRGPPGDNLNSKDLKLTASASVDSTAKAMAKDSNAGSVGIGAGAAINIVDDVTIASIDDGVTFATGTGPKNVTLTATDTDSTTTYAEAGASGASGSTLALTADAAIALPTVTTTASIAGDASQTLSTQASGNVTLTATQTATSTTTAKGNAAGGTVAIGLALALAIPDDEVTASISRTVSANNVSLTASGSSTTTTEADASAAGAAGADSGTKKDSSGKDVNGKADDQLSSANADRTSATGKSAKTTDTSNAKAQTSDNNGTSGSGDKNTVTVAGAAAINIVTALSKAWFLDTAHVTATGTTTLKALANTDSVATGTGKATDAGTVGIGAGVAVNSATFTNIATVGNATVTSNGLDIESEMRVNGTDHLQRFDGTSWTTIDSGAAFPEGPSDGDFFQLTNGVPATTQIDGDSQTIDSSHTSLKVKSTANFGPSGTFTIAGKDGTCTYTGKDATHLTGVTGCTIASSDKIDKLTITQTTTGFVDGGGQALSTTTTISLAVVSTADFASTGQFTIAGVTGTCTYTGTDATHFTGVTGCTGTPTDGAKISPIAKTPGVYKWSDSANDWQLQSKGIPTSTGFLASPSNGDYVQLTKDASTTATAQTLSGSLQVASTAGFAPTGSFTLNGNTCTYTGLDATHLTGVSGTGCSGAIANGAAVTSTAQLGIYKWNGSAWTFIGDGTTLPDSPASGDLFRLAEHNVAATAQSGAGGDSDKVSIAGALALNIVTNDTEATVGASAHVTLTGGVLTLIAKSNEEDVAKADSDAESGKVGIGASAAIQVLTGNTTNASVTDGATLTCSSCTTLTITADSRHVIETEDKAGAAGGISIAPSVALNIDSDSTTAHLGTGAG
ncbi:MAG: hypothetical protein ABUS54_06080, partial [Actinomycetota bacterium]